MTARSFFYFFARERLAATPWKNGGGSTREIACWPPGASLDNFHWRASIATIDAPGPFSVFEGIDRQIMLLEGDGVQLRSPDGGIDHRLDMANEPFAFDGEAVIDCSLLDGRSHDFNVMTRRSRCRAEVQVVRDPAASVRPCKHGLLYALRGHWTLAPAEAIAQGEGIWWGDTPQGWQARADTPDALLLAVRIIDLEPAETA